MTAPVVTAEHMKLARNLGIGMGAVQTLVARAIAAAEQRGREAGIREARAEVVHVAQKTVVVSDTWRDAIRAKAGT